MVDRLVIENTKLAQQLQRLAKQEHRSVEEVLSSMLAQYEPLTSTDELPDADEMVRQVRLAAYQQARDYWQANGDAERAVLTDEQLDQSFWLFDADGIPRLKNDKDRVSLPESSLYRAGQVLRSAGFRSGQTDIGARSREILNDEYANYLLSRMNRRTDDASTPSA